MTTLREELTPAQRAEPLLHVIDPGFVNHRRIETILGAEGMPMIDDAIGRLPNLPDWQREVRIAHIYSEAMLLFCRAAHIKPLGELLADERGRMFCSTERLAPCPDVFGKERAISLVLPHLPHNRRVELHYTTRNIKSDTLRAQLSSGDDNISIIAEMHAADTQKLVFHPLVMGNACLLPGDARPDFDIMWHGRDFYEHYVEDIDEFAQVGYIATPPDPTPMKKVSERAFKACLQRLLGDAAPTDWGGESSDYFSGHVHLSGRRTSAAFLLKGPARFKPMDLTHLGKNGDQIVRLAKEPADLLVVQHSHDILPPVRETLRAFAVKPSEPRRYCLIDGRDSLRLLQAYDLYDFAVQSSQKCGPAERQSGKSS